MKAIIGKKLEMTQVFKDDGTVVPVTLVQTGPCTVLEIREHDSKKKVVVGFGTKKHTAKPQLCAWGVEKGFAFVCEFILPDGSEIKVGDTLNVTDFLPGDLVNAIGESKGKGFQGVVKRHGFHGSPKTHGHKDQLRMPGSIGAGGVQHVFKGTRMGGRMGGDRVTVKNLEIVNVNDKDGILAVKGAVPGCRGSFIQLIGTQGNVWQK
ncbi:50S ribosomal protein L3 [Patescibacteria group bacterium]|nr:50S ribosomal protein L3 [Patescibacteria group bacterium]MBU4452862.1 50S ribosomal protein L3 [Patescibacteria group bacterium]MCG2687566.1 50S ribosomal protein L3 [Candidatus Parcubacteria bacterium]